MPDPDSSAGRSTVRSPDVTGSRTVTFPFLGFWMICNICNYFCKKIIIKIVYKFENPLSVHTIKCGHKRYLTLEIQKLAYIDFTYWVD